VNARPDTKESVIGVEGGETPPTEMRLFDAAVELFSRKWYGTVSVAEICRAAGLSNGVFYRYYENKEALFRRILGRVLDLVKETVEGVEGDCPRDRLDAFAESIILLSEERKALVSVFREGQYRFFEYERRLVAIYTRGLSAVLGKEVGLPEYLYALGGIRFCAIRRAFQGSDIDIGAVRRILAEGLFPGLSFEAAKVFGGQATPLPLSLEESARDRLLRAGKRLFGEKGYYETNIHEVTDAAGLSVGAFYTYFPSKEAFYAEIIRLVGHEVRSFISRNLDAGLDLNRLEREMRGLWLFLVYLAIDKNCYNIVREAEFVLPSAVREYYGAFVEGYRKGGGAYGPPDAHVHEATAIEFLLGIAHYFGIEVAFDESPGNARAVVETIGSYLVGGLSAFLGPKEG
jgi:AcrR family transcriptional regulator